MRPIGGPWSRFHLIFLIWVLGITGLGYGSVPAAAQTGLSWQLGRVSAGEPPLDTPDSVGGQGPAGMREGSGSLQALRGLLFDELAPLSLNSQSSELVFDLAPESRLEVHLEARLSAGAAWQYTGDPAILIAETAPAQPRGPGKGVPAVQTFTLTNPTQGALSAKFVYGRWFEPEAAPEMILRLEGIDTSQALELTDPTFVSFLSAALNSAATVEAVPAETQAASLSLPAYYDSRQYGLVTPPRDQGSCGSCWAFGTAGMMETALARAGLGLRDLSEQFLVNCNDHAWGCGGGLTAHPFHRDRLDLLGLGPGAVMEYFEPYSATDEKCVALPRAYRLADWAYVVGGKSYFDEGKLPAVDQIKAAIYKYGAVTAGVCAGSNFMRYRSGIYTGDECSYNLNRNPITDHQIMLVGWNDANQTWLLKNSYGPGWGMQGYMWIHWGASRVGEGASWARMEAILPIPSAPRGLTETLSPEFRWLPADGASSYDIQVQNVLTGKQTTLPKISTNAAALPDALEYGSYRWRVRSNLSSNWSGWAEFWMLPDDPQPLLPKGVSLRTEPMYFTWLEAKGNEAYTLELPAPLVFDPGTVINCQKGVCRAAISLDGLLPGTYTWSVRRISGAYAQPIEFELLEVKSTNYLPLIATD